MSCYIRKSNLINTNTSKIKHKNIFYKRNLTRFYNALIIKINLINELLIYSREKKNPTPFHIIFNTIETQQNVVFYSTVVDIFIFGGRRI